MNMNYNYSTTIFESIFAKIHLFMVVKHFIAIFADFFFHGKKQKLEIIPEIHIFGPKYFHTL